jgi:predicted DNA-binding protein (UPF0251 family)
MPAEIAVGQAAHILLQVAEDEALRMRDAAR